MFISTRLVLIWAAVYGSVYLNEEICDPSRTEISHMEYHHDVRILPFLIHLFRSCRVDMRLLESQGFLRKKCNKIICVELIGVFSHNTLAEY